MKKSVIWILVIAVVTVGAWYWYQKSAKGVGTDQYATVQDLGMYPYQCDNDSEFILSPLEGMKTVQVSADSQGMFTGTASLSQVGGTSYKGIVPDGQSVAIVGDGETIHLTVGTAQTKCNPKPNPDEAPWNWGDPSTTTSQ